MVSSGLPVPIIIYMAFAGGVLARALETVRRWLQLTNPAHFINWFDDYIIGAFLFFAAWKTYKGSKYARKYLSGTAPVSSATVAIVKGAMFLICIICLVISMCSSSAAPRAKRLIKILVNMGAFEPISIPKRLYLLFA